MSDTHAPSIAGTPRQRRALCENHKARGVVDVPNSVIVEMGPSAGLTSITEDVHADSAYVESNVLGVLLPYLLSIALHIIDYWHGPGANFLGLQVAFPLLAAAMTGPFWTAFVGIVITFGAVLTGALPWTDWDFTTTDTAPIIHIVAIACTSFAAVAVSHYRRQKADRFHGLTQVADAAQQAIVRPIPREIGDLKLAARMVAAARDALIGGDIVEVIQTRFGVRVLIGDVRGHGLGAMALAGQVLGSFREHAWTAETLEELAARLDHTVSRSSGLEDFVTALIVQIDTDRTVTLLSCGHPAPYRIAGRDVEQINVDSLPPLGLMFGESSTSSVQIDTGDRLVMVTDGLLEARRVRRPWSGSGGGAFLPITLLLSRHFGEDDLENALEDLVAAARSWSRGKIQDDMTVLAIEVT